MGLLKQFKMEEKIMTIHDYVEIIKKLQNLRKENPNDFTLGTKVRKYLESLESESEYTETKVRL